MIDGLPDPPPTGLLRGSIGSLAVPATTTTPFLSNSLKRVGLLLQVSAGLSGAFNNRPLTAITDGFQYVSAQSPLYLNADNIGDIVTKGWHVFLSGAGTISWIEIIRD
jgi:hypothetical protein